MARGDLVSCLNVIQNNFTLSTWQFENNMDGERNISGWRCTKGTCACEETTFFDNGEVFGCDPTPGPFKPLQKI
jgi:hypothetical protein